MTYSRQPSSSREARIASILVSTNRSRSFGSTENTPCTITTVMLAFIGDDRLSGAKFLQRPPRTDGLFASQQLRLCNLPEP